MYLPKTFKDVDYGPNWPFLTFFNFYFIPSQYRVQFDDLMMTFWLTFISYIENRHMYKENTDNNQLNTDVNKAIEQKPEKIEPKLKEKIINENLVRNLDSVKL